MNGIVVVNKPKGITSQQVVGRIRKIFGLKRVGHTGTLDPDVDGVLPICIGNATRVAEYMLDQRKGYSGEVTFGYSTDTQDATGQIIQRKSEFTLTEKMIQTIFSQFQGEMDQIPPSFSALKVNGKRAYDLARKGEHVALAPRKITIYSLQIIQMELGNELPRVRFNVECSKGTYIRTLCHDMGRALGIPSHMSKLTRTKSGPFTLEMSHTIEEIEQAKEIGKLEQFVLSPSVALKNFPVYSVSDNQQNLILNGREMSFPMGNRICKVGDRIRVESQSNKLLAVYRVIDIVGDHIHTKPEKVFKE